MFNYSNSYMQPQMPRYNPQYQPYNNQQIQSQMQQPAMQNYTPQAVQIQGLQGKTVDSVDVVKAMDIPLDGSISYFPLVDGSAIVTKQLQQDGTSKITIYKPIEADEAIPTKYATIEDIDTRIKDIKMPDMKPLQDEIKTLKKQIRILLDKEE